MRRARSAVCLRVWLAVVKPRDRGSRGPLLGFTSRFGASRVELLLLVGVLDKMLNSLPRPWNLRINNWVLWNQWEFCSGFGRSQHFTLWHLPFLLALPWTSEEHKEESVLPFVRQNDRWVLTPVRCTGSCLARSPSCCTDTFAVPVSTGQVQTLPEEWDQTGSCWPGSTILQSKSTCTMPDFPQLWNIYYSCIQHNGRRICKYFLCF